MTGVRWSVHSAHHLVVLSDKFSNVPIVDRATSRGQMSRWCGRREVPQLRGSTPGPVLGDVRVLQRLSGPVAPVTVGVGASEVLHDACPALITCAERSRFGPGGPPQASVLGRLSYQYQSWSHRCW